MFSNCNFCYSFFFLLLFAIAKLSFFVFFFFCWCHSTDRRQNNRNQFWVNEDLLSNNDCRRPSYLIALTSTLSKIVRSSDATCTCGFSTNSFESFNSIAAHRTSWPNDSVQFSVCIRAAAVLVKHVAAFEQHTISTYMNISLRVANVFSLLSLPQFVSQKMGQQQQMNNPNFMKSPAVRIEQSQNRFHERERNVRGVLKHTPFAAYIQQQQHRTRGAPLSTKWHRRCLYGECVWVWDETLIGIDGQICSL